MKPYYTGENMTIDTIVERVNQGANLLENLKLIDPKTWQTSQEVFRDWQRGAFVLGVNIANLAVYRLVNDEVMFDLLGREGNPFVDEKFQEEAYNGIINNEFFSPHGAMKQHIQAAIRSAATVCYSPLHIKTKNCSSNYGYVEVDGDNTREEKKLFQRVYGTKKPGNEKRVYLLRENVVREQLQGNEDDLIVRACYFLSNRCFDADARYIDLCNVAVRGVRRRNVAEGDAKNVPCAPQETDNVRTAYTIVFDNINSLSSSDALRLYEALQPRIMDAARKNIQS